MNKSYDVVVLGSGNAGMGVAGVAREAGKSVAVIESRDPGGTCPLRGCVPKKVLVGAAQVLHQIDIAGDHHIEVGPPRLDWAKLIEREREFVDGVPAMFRDSLEGRGIDLYDGPARFTGANEITVGDTVLNAGKIVIATGSTPRTLPIPGAGHMITSDDLLEDPALPGSLVFIGGGVIALEFGHVLARAGTRVTILEAMDRLLPRMDEDAVEQLRGESERIGIEILTGVDVQKIAAAGDAFEVHFEHGGEVKILPAERIANGAGRVPDVDGLDLAAGGIEHDGTRIAVDEHLRSVSNPDVYVAGDALWTSPQLSPVATYEGRLVGRHIVDGDGDVPDYGAIPANVFTVPALASVGLSEAEATEKGLAFAAKTNDMTTWRSARTHAETVAWSKVLVEDGSGRILGAHMVGHGAEEVIHLFAFAIKHGIAAAELASGVYAYPTFTSDIKFLV